MKDVPVERIRGGALLVDKPVGPTSRRILDALERRLKLGPLGHAGTLDPLASGLLVALAGRARRLQNLFTASTKTYRAQITFGWRSETLDAEGPLVADPGGPPKLDRESVEALVSPFAGEVMQVPPRHSAVHVAGRRAHRLARSGAEPVLEPRPVRIDAIRVLDVRDNVVALEVTCGPGTYIRSLARDLGEAQGSGAWLSALRRTRSGGFQVEDAVLPEDLVAEDLIPLRQLLRSFPRIDVGPEEARRLAQGATIPGPGTPRPEAGPTFAWHADEPLCRLRFLEGEVMRSDLLLR